MLENYLTIDELCKLANVSRQTINMWKKAGLPYHKVGHAVLFDENEAKKWMMERFISMQIEYSSKYISDFVLEFSNGLRKRRKMLEGFEGIIAEIRNRLDETTAKNSVQLLQFMASMEVCSAVENFMKFFEFSTNRKLMQRMESIDMQLSDIPLDTIDLTKRIIQMVPEKPTVAEMKEIFEMLENPVYKEWSDGVIQDIKKQEEAFDVNKILSSIFDPANSTPERKRGKRKAI